jgi:hypothetical protein
MNRLQVLIADLEELISQQGLRNESVSNGSVGWHIEHCLLTFDKIIYALKTSDPAKYKWSFNLKRMLVSVINKIPRGRANAPGVVQPAEYFDEATLRAHIAKTKHYIITLHHLQPRHYFEHPYFGKLKLKSAIKFMALHTRHHIHIIRDIIKAGTAH